MEYHHAYDLVKAIEESETYRELETLYQKVAQDEAARTMLKDLRTLEVGLELKQLSGEALTNEETKHYERMLETVRLHPDINRLLNLEQWLAQVYDDIQKILAEPFNRLVHLLD